MIIVGMASVGASGARPNNALQKSRATAGRPYDINYKEQGSALIIALFIVALAVIMATSMAVRFHSEIRIDERIFSQQRLTLINQGALFWGLQIIKSDATNPQKIVDVLPQSFAQTTKEGYSITANLEDAQTKFNLNNLSNPEYIPLFANLIKNTSPQIASDQAQKMAEAVMSKLIQKAFPNQSQLFLFWRIEELQQINGFTPDIYTQLKPYITALPEVTPINISNASAMVLQSLSPNMTPENISKIMADRLLKKSYASISDWITQENLGQAKLPADLLTITSSYFNLTSTASEPGDSLQRHYLLHRIVQNNKVSVVVIYQS